MGLNVSFTWWNIVMFFCGCIIGFGFMGRRIWNEEEHTTFTIIKVIAISIFTGVLISGAMAIRI